MNQSGRDRLTALFLRHAPDAGRLAYVMTGDLEAAQDILQEAFIRLFGQFRDLRNPESFQAYLRTTIVNLSRDRFRKLKAERRFARHGGPNSLSDPVAVGDVERRETLRRALRELPYRQQAALVLRYYEDLTERETAEVLNCSVRAVKGLVSRGKEALRQSIRGDDV